MRKIFLILILCLATQLVFVSSAAYGDSLTELQEKINYLENQNQSLEVEIASLTSCGGIVQRAAELGLTGKTDFSVALKR